MTSPAPPPYPPPPTAGRLSLVGRVPALLVLLIGAVLVTRIALTYTEFNATLDEFVHIAAGIERYQFGTYTMDVEHPPVSRLAIGLLPYLAGIRLQSTGYIWADGRRLLEDPAVYWRTLTLARIGNLVFVPVLLFFVYRWGSLLYGRPAGLAACGLITFCPNIIAHASLAATDFAAAVSLFAAAFCLWRWTLRPGLVPCLIAGTAVGTALASKFSAMVYLPPILAAYFLIGRRKSLTQARRNFAPLKVALGQAVVLGATAVLVVWAAYGFTFNSLSKRIGLPHPTIDGVAAPGSALNRILCRVVETKWIPATGYFEGIKEVYRHSQMGHQSFLLGSVGHRGRWYYFLVVLAVKSTLPLLLAVATAAVVLLWRGALGPSVYLLAGAAAILGIAMLSTINIGVRHILAIYPFVAVLASALFQNCWLKDRTLRWIPVLGTALLAWQASESLRAHPDYLAYFNQIAVGREHRILADSNLDWGQDLARLARYLKAHGIEHPYLSYYGTADPAVFGIRGRHFGPHDRPTGWVAVSRSRIQGLVTDSLQPGYGWLEACTPYASIGKSIVVYYFPEPPGGNPTTIPRAASSATSRSRPSLTPFPVDSPTR